jgi:arylsulfate sulfotransferase
MKARLCPSACALCTPLLAVLGCGGGGSSADFSLQAAPSTITITPGEASQSLSVVVAPQEGFKGTVVVTLGSLPAGVTAMPSSLALAPDAPGLFTLSAAATAAPGTSTITVNGSSGMISHMATSSLTVGQPRPIPQLSSTSFDFGNNLVNNTVTKTVVVVTNPGPGAFTMSPSLSGDPSYSIDSGTSCTSQLAAGANCNMVVDYTPKTASAPATQMATLNMGFANVPAGTSQTIAITGIAAVLPTGQVTATNNPQVALYTMALPFPGSMTVHISTPSYGLQTWSQSSSQTGGQVSIFVAGMLPSTTYQMQAVVTLDNGVTASDTAHTFTTGAVPANMQLPIDVTATPGMAPQPGLELLDVLGQVSGVLITDLSGNILWTYANPSTSQNLINGVQMLPNGHLLLVIGANSSLPLSGPIPDGTINELREVDLAGNTVHELTIDDLNASLASATCAGCNIKLETFHHDIEALPNGHYLVVSNTLMALSPTSTPPLTNSGSGTTTVLGDVILDLDENMRPVWVWNSFSHLDPNRHPYLFPDWTHLNAVLYSPDDGNFIISIRHQNWVLKVNYANGAGDGSILWHLGQGGDMTLVGGTDPTDWQYAQHAPSYFGSNTSGVFSLGLMDNGDDRIFPSGVTCGSAGAPPCLYTTVPVWQIDENAKTATFTFHQILPPSLYSNFGGNTEQLANGNVEYDLCGTNAGSFVYEVTQESNPQTVWSFHEAAANLYRAFRIPSMYPGVQW